ncbi:LysR family transcriptional regulator [Kribbella sp. NPDC051952]|uniref:LysR family transcriptional regulator n=1 Tax=Kribbella sp. NPDC051952 TaxID=3154851 RepID=UPI00344A3E77
MSLTAWRTFVMLGRLGSLSAVAAELGYTQSAVSRQVAALETLVGVPLVRRVPRGIVLTAAGEAFRAHALVAVNAADRAVRAARDATVGSQRPLVVGATPSLAAGVVPAAMDRLLEESGPRPWSLVAALTRELYDRLLAGEIDLAVVTDAPPGLPNQPGLVLERLGSDEMMVVVSKRHRLAGSARIGIAALADETWVEDNDGSAALLRNHAARAGVTPRIDLTAADLPGKLAMAATGHAVALVPGSLTAALRPDVTSIHLQDAPTREIYALLPGDDRHPATEDLIHLLRQEVTASTG